MPDAIKRPHRIDQQTWITDVVISSKREKQIQKDAAGHQPQ